MRIVLGNVKFKQWWDAMCKSYLFTWSSIVLIKRTKSFGSLYIYKRLTDTSVQRRQVCQGGLRGKRLPVQTKAGGPFKVTETFTYETLTQ